jgi:hypothetical protein
MHVGSSVEPGYGRHIDIFPGPLDETAPSSPSTPRQVDVALESMERRGNLQLVKDDERKFPGLLIQGDTLSTLLDDLEEELPDGFATRTVRDWLGAYEEMMAAANVKLPYVR